MRRNPTRRKHFLAPQPRNGRAMPRNLLLLPGLLCDARLWRDAADGLVADLAQDDSMAGMAARALALADAQWGPRSQFAVAGLSMGGYVAMEIWRQAAPRVTQLVLLDTSARPDTTEQRERRQALMALSRQGQFKGVTPRLLPMLIHPSRLGSPLAEEVMEMAGRIGPAAFLRQQRAIMDRPDSRPMLPGITVPTLLGCGAEDILTPPDRHAEMAALIPHARLEQFPGCGHLPTMEDPAAVAPVLAQFLAAS